MFEDFKNAVLVSYAEKKKKKQLSDNLENPTQAKLRQECLSVLEKRYNKKDDETIIRFFDSNNKFDSHELRIQKFELDGFKSLLKFLLNGHGIRKEENIKLLAWLIDFEPRPYVFGQTYDTPKEEEEEEIVTPLPIPSPPVTIVNWKKVSIISLLLILIAVLGLSKYTSGDGQKKVPSSEDTSGNEKTPPTNEDKKRPEANSLTVIHKQCMYWSVDRYIAVACNQKIPGAIIVAIDKQKIERLRKITDLDTVGKKDIGRIWYVKIKVDSVEFYTDSGSYPLEPKKILKPMTEHMLNKYILSKR